MNFKPRHGCVERLKTWGVQDPATTTLITSAFMMDLCCRSVSGAEGWSALHNRVMGHPCAVDAKPWLIQEVKICGHDTELALCL